MSGLWRAGLALRLEGFAPWQRTCIGLAFWTFRGRMAEWWAMPTLQILTGDYIGWEPPFMQPDFVNRANTEYIDQLYQRYQADPRSIDPQWREFFSRMEYDAPARPGGNGAGEAVSGKSARPTSGTQAATGTDIAPRVNDLIHAYRELGHF